MKSNYCWIQGSDGACKVREGNWEGGGESEKVGGKPGAVQNIFEVIGVWSGREK